MRIDYSYYSLTLLQYLRSSHPHLVNNTEFINSRAELAATACQNTKLQGHTTLEAEELANQILFDGLKYSVHDTITSILEEQFEDKIDVVDRRDVAIIMYSYIHDNELLDLEQITDDFETRDPEIYNTFYTELIGVITTYLEEYGVH